ncbi:MAG: patatin-like phospholipase family protein [Bacteroidales bacterium]|jgi:NTE family protein|nr:patatin-like phospholipase family protein [Bacteroidales bacterium]
MEINLSETIIVSKRKSLKNKTYQTGVALSGGGIKGLCHAGALKALNEYGIKPDIISGVSAGAIVGALYADGYTPDEIGEIFYDVTFSRFAKIQFPVDGLFQMDLFKTFLHEKIRAETFEELSIPLRIVATDLDHGKTKVFEKGNLIDPIIASSSLPILFKPIVIHGINYVDGGVLKNFPVGTIYPDCQYIIGINASPFVAKEYNKSLRGIIGRTYHFMSKANILQDKALCDILIEPENMASYETFDVEKSREIFKLGYESTKEILSHSNLETFKTIDN